MYEQWGITFARICVHTLNFIPARNVHEPKLLFGAMDKYLVYVNLCAEPEIQHEPNLQCNILLNWDLIIMGANVTSKYISYVNWYILSVSMIQMISAPRTLGIRESGVVYKCQRLRPDDVVS